MNQRIQDMGGRQANELAKGLREGQKELGAELLREIDKFRSSLVQTEEQSKMRRLVSEGKYAELYFYAKSLPVVGANNEAATKELNKWLLKVLDTAYEGLQKVRNKIAEGTGETLAEKVAKTEEELRRLTTNLQNSEMKQKILAKGLQTSEKERKRLAEVLQNSEKGLEEVLQNNEESLRRCLAACDAIEFKGMLKESTAAMDKQYEPHKKKDIITKLGDRLNAVENEFDLALAKLNVQLGTKAAEVREFRRIVDAKGEEVNKRIAEEEEEEKKKPLSVEKGECALSQHLVERLLAEYTEHKAYADVKKAYEDLVSNSSGDPVPRTVMLIYYNRSFTHPCDLDTIDLDRSLVGDKGATILACGLKLSTKITELRLRKQAPA
ncbi:MAG: hypothetical protein P4L69_20290 [Desulfosporosinus sp.]|nr:hypothetical protein [Desulfosporosinus sp.]